jgi:hypothetical protein
MFKIAAFLSLLLASFVSFYAYSAEKPLAYENDYFRLQLSPRTPNQIAAFYTGRGFPPFAIEELRQSCFVTVGLRNKSKQIVWLDLSNWQFITADGELKRYRRSDWKKRWKELGLEKRFQSTFRWTLMPEKLDFRPYEGEGGNIILPRAGKPFSLIASIAVGEKQDKSFKIKIENIKCASDE